MLIANQAVAQEALQIRGLAPGQLLPLDERMALCEDARELRSRLHSGGIHKLRVQCKDAGELFTVHVDGNDRIYSITLRKDIEQGISRELIAEMRDRQIERYGPADIDKHKLPEGFTGEVWQYGWGERCVVDEEFDRIMVGKGLCLVVDTDLTASKKLLIEYSELTDSSLDPGRIASSETDLELYSAEKGATTLDFSKESSTTEDSGDTKADQKKEKDNGDVVQQVNPTVTVTTEIVSAVNPTPEPTTGPAPESVSALDCRALYDELKSRATGDIAICSKPWPTADIKQCEAPATFSADRPTSHVVVVLDASGSMAAQIDGESKMTIAKREISDFLSALTNDVPVGLMIYGHRGDHTEQSKAISCGAYEWAVPVGSEHGSLKSVVNQLEPAGWTPLGGTLAYLERQLAGLDGVGKDAIASPVVYVVSDGKETCDGDPVNAARSLNASGVRAVVNVVGFDVGEETRTELEAISIAGGGQYFPASDSSALRKQLRAARDNEAAIARYNDCINLNVGKAEVDFHNRMIDVTGCYLREANTKWRDVINNDIKAFSSNQEKYCGREVRQLMQKDYKVMRNWFLQDGKENQRRRKSAARDAYASSRFKLPAQD